MKDIVINNKSIQFEKQGEQIFCTSLDIANVFEKRYADVLELIYEKLTNEEIKDFTERNFPLSEYKDSTGRTLPCYKLTRDGFSFIAIYDKKDKDGNVIEERTQEDAKA